MFRIREERYRLSGTLASYGFRPVEKANLHASYLIALRIARQKKPHTDAETFLKPCALDIALLLFDSDSAKKIDKICLSDDSIRSRIDDMSLDVEEQVVKELKESIYPFSLQLDESTDVANCNQLLVFVRYIRGTTVKEEFLFCSPLKTTSRAADIFAAVNDYFNNNDIDWSQVGSVCTDSAPAMVGRHSGFVALVREKAPEVVFTHCVLHRHALATKMLPKSLQKVMDDVIEAVNFIHSHALQHRLFQQLYEEMGSEYTRLLYHTDVRWLSRGKVFKRAIDLLDGIEGFLREKGNALAQYLGDPIFAARLAYMSDIFTHLNELNVSLQGKGVTIIEADAHITAMKERLSHWHHRLSENPFHSFPNLRKVLQDNSNDHFMTEAVKKDVREHLKILIDNFDRYSTDLTAEPWMADPFTGSIQEMVVACLQCLVEFGKQRAI